ncbi:integrator complex subunit 10 isoform X2 [Bombina bombina]|uniref:integrator complex subunit 10 isoform X2 n=1 Tax=Bombina bombina TaxID=8345 RepID=UPI00235AC0B0|nr:integrator complex subunit 10 isoform X2 [Bombina bombina]
MATVMAGLGDCEFLVRRARELVLEDTCAARAWLITARTLYPQDFNIQYEMYSIERNAERTVSAGRLLYDMFVNFPDQPVVWREITVITAALRNDSQDKQTQFLRGLFETLPGRVQCEMLLKATEQCFNTLERAEMLLLLLRRFPETVVQHGVSLGETLLESEGIEDQESPVNCFRKLFVCDVLPLIINNLDVRLPASLLYKYLHKAAEFYISYVTRSPQVDGQHQNTPDTSDILSPSKRSSQKYIIEGLTEKSSQILDPWERLIKILSVVGMRCEWQMDKGTRGFNDLLHRMKDLCRYISNFENEAHAKYKNQVVYSTALVFFKNVVQYISNIQPSLFQGPNTPNQVPIILLEDVSNVYSEVELNTGKHIHKRRKLAETREKTMSSDDEDLSGKGRSRHVVVSKNDLANPNEVLESFKIARECWDLLHSSEALEKEFTRLCLPWKTDTWLWLRIFLTDMVIYQGQHKKAITSLHHLAALQGPNSPTQQIMTQGTLEQQRALVQLASCHFSLGEYRLTCEKILELMNYIVPTAQDVSKAREEPAKLKTKHRKGSDLKLLPCTNKAVLPYCLQLLLASLKLRAFTDNRDDMSLGHVIVLLQHDWPKGENLFLKAISKICQQGNFQYENFFNYITNIDMLEEFAYLRTQEGGKIHLELIPNQGVLLKTSSTALSLLQQEFIPVLQPSIAAIDRHHTVTRGITKGVKEDFRLAMERQVSRCTENLMVVLHRFCINEKILLLQSLA